MSLTFEDVERRGLTMVGSCRRCRCARMIPVGDNPRWRAMKAKAAGRTVGELYALGLLTCSGCGDRLDALKLQAGGNLIMGFEVVGVWSTAPASGPLDGLLGEPPLR